MGLRHATPEGSAAKQQCKQTDLDIAQQYLKKVAALKETAAETPIRPAGNQRASGLASSLMPPVDSLSGVADKQRESGGKSSGAASPASPRMNPIVRCNDGIDTVTAGITAAAEETGLAGGM